MSNVIFIQNEALTANRLDVQEWRVRLRNNLQQFCNLRCGNRGHKQPFVTKSQEHYINAIQKIITVRCSDLADVGNVKYQMFAAREF